MSQRWQRLIDTVVEAAEPFRRPRQDHADREANIEEKQT
jgi:hypothetical protein